MFNKETEYAIRALIYIQKQNNSGKNPGVSEIAEEIQASVSFIAKILQRLVKRTLLASKKGKGGGFFIDSKKPALSLKELVILMEGEALFLSCGIGLKKCHHETPCPLHQHFSKIREAMDDMLATLTIQLLATDEQAYLKILA